MKANNGGYKAHVVAGRDWICTIRNMYGKANSCADWMVPSFSSGVLGLQVFEDQSP